MAKQKRYQSRPSAPLNPILNSQDNKKPSAELRDFGMLKVRSMEFKQSQARVFKEAGQSQNFAQMDGEQIMRIIQGSDAAQIRALSKFYAQTNGIYARAVRYLADTYRFDFLIYPNLDLIDDVTDEFQEKCLKRFNKVLEYFDSSAIQMQTRKWAAQVCLEGVYYGYICDDIADKLVIQDLPSNYCRSRFIHRGKPMIEFNVKYFDRITNDEKYRTQLLNLFPEEIKLGYKKYIQGGLPPEAQGDEAGWIMLDIKRAFKFNFYDSDIPPFLFVIPALMNLAEVEDLEKEKLLQDLQKILVQTFELDKNGQIPFTMKELQRLNQNAIDMVGDAVGVSVLSTVADVHLENLAAETGKQSQGNIAVAQNGVYNDMGISTNLFNTDGNLALEKSTITDAAFVKQLLLQFEFFLNEHITWKFNKNDSKFRLKMLETSIFNYIDLSDKYKDLTKIGFSRFLPMVALGHSQKEVVSMAKLEQQIMQLDNWMLPPFSSNTLSSQTWSEVKALQKSEGLSQGLKPTNPSIDNPEKGGRPELPDDKKSEKTIANNES
jgi:hypothetical protein